jgi:hypothetical protein
MGLFPLKSSLFSTVSKKLACYCAPPNPQLQESNVFEPDAVTDNYMNMTKLTKNRFFDDYRVQSL